MSTKTRQMCSERTKCTLVFACGRIPSWFTSRTCHLGDFAYSILMPLLKLPTLSSHVSGERSESRRQASLPDEGEVSERERKFVRVSGTTKSLSVGRRWRSRDRRMADAISRRHSN